MKKHVRIVGLAVGCLILAAFEEVCANNIRVTNVASKNQNLEAKTVYVSFTLSWDNAWRGAENWDAAWVFVKFRAPGSNNWQHATLSTVSGDHLPAANSTISAVPDGKGVFVYPASGYTGSVNYANTKLLWTYGSNGYNFAKGDMVEVSVHAIEMVYIPQGPFFLGSGGTEDYRFYLHSGTQNTNPYPVASEAAITVGENEGNLWTPNGGAIDAGVISNTFPKGHAAFYGMKYEISQGQYVDFLNKLTDAQDHNRYPSQYGNARHVISGTYTNYRADVPDRACNYLSWADVIAYADWSGLRPMTELEYEKACRGPETPVANEYAWGTATIMNHESRQLSGAEDGTETVTNASAVNGGAYYGHTGYAHTGGDGGYGPLRCGIFATNNCGRVRAGAGYYGMMDLSGNLYERTVTAGNAVGRKFSGTLGDGVLSSSGNATGNSDWPGTDASGAGSRGCTYFNAAYDLRTSDRLNARDSASGRDYFYGGRAVRQAP